MSTIKETVQRGFTLLELLIVIAILAIITTLVVVILNPGELLAQGRDGQRLSDLSSIKSALTLYIKDRGCTATTWKAYGAAATPSTSNLTVAGRVVDGTGWLSNAAASPVDASTAVVNFTLVNGGSPLAVLPADPSDVAGPMTAEGSTNFHYLFRSDTAANNCTFELNANMESQLYKNKSVSPSTQQKEGGDGGNSDYLYETGTILTLITAPTV